MNQPELFLPPPATNDILRERIKDIERQVIAAETKGDDGEVQRLLGERKRVKGIMNAGKP